ncbi:hypothetical protein K1X84_14630 [bacterium]|nr:hypothetical protein [bacterium]
MSNSCNSIDALAEKVLKAIESNDAQTLDGLRINQEEFKKYLWPEFPASKNDVPYDFAWDNLNGKTIKGLRRALSDYGTQTFELESVSFKEGIEEYPTFKIHTKTVLHVKDKVGNEKKLEFCGSIVERNGEYKLLSYRD